MRSHTRAKGRKGGSDGASQRWAGASSEDARRQLLELLGDLGGGAVEVGRDGALLVGRQPVEEGAEIAVDDALDREVRGAEEELVAAAERRRLLSQVHLERLQQLEVLLGGEGEQRRVVDVVGALLWQPQQEDV